MEKVNLEQGTADWLNYRIQMFNASEAGAVMGVNPWMPANPAELYDVKKGIKEVQFNAMMKRGHDLEDAAREYYNFLSGETFTPAVYKSGRFSASLDGINLSETEILELKCPTNLDKWYSEENLETIAPQYFWQIVHQMFVCEKASDAHFMIYDGTTAVYMEHYTREMLEPYFEPLSYAWDQFALYFDRDERPPKGFDPVDDNFVLYRDVYFDAKDAYEEAKSILDTAKNDLIELYGEVHAHGIKVTKIKSKGSINYKAKDIQSRLADLDLEEYRAKDKESWRITIDK